MLNDLKQKFLLEKSIYLDFGIESELTNFRLHELELKDLHQKGNPSQKRIQDFTLGRLAGKKVIRECLDLSSIGDAIIRRDKSGAPSWPENLIGSIAHAKDLGIAVCCKKDRYKSIGIDLENLDRKLGFPIEEYIATPEEINLIKKSVNPTKTSLIFFSLKEALYKALFPLVNRYVGFEEVSISFVKEVRDEKLKLVEKEWSVILNFDLYPAQMISDKPGVDVVDPYIARGERDLGFAKSSRRKYKPAQMNFFNQNSSALGLKESFKLYSYEVNWDKREYIVSLVFS